MTKLLLKNKLTTAFIFLLFTALVPMQSMAQAKKVAYITFQKTMAAGASTVGDDAIIRMFQGDSRFTITVLTDTGTSSTTTLTPANTNLNDYDLIIVQEPLGSGSPIFNSSSGLLAIKNITKPVIYNKVYALNKSKTANITTNGVAADVADVAVVVPTDKQNNALFTGIDFQGGTALQIFNQRANDDGGTADATKLKSLQYCGGFELSTANTCLATVTGSTITNSLAINDIPGGTQFGTNVADVLPLTSRMIAFAWNYGAIANGNGTNLTANALKLWQNAALILTGQPLLGVKENALASDSISVYPNPTNGLITVNSTTAVKAITVYDTTGKQISASKTNTVDLSNQAKGIYLVQVQTENGSTTKKVMVE
jgi:hypothetical protein